MRPAFTGLWRHPDFVKLWAAQSISQFGSYIGWVALQFTAVLWLDATPLQVSLLTACQLVPAFLVGLIAGVWVDRLHRRPLLIAADTGRAIALATIPAAAALGALRVEQLYLVALVTSALTVLFDVAYEAYLPSLVQPEQLVEGNSKLTASASVAEFAGFGGGGWLVQALNGPAAILIDAVSFLWSAFFLGRIKAPEPAPAPHEQRQSIWHEAREGVRVVAHSSILRSLATASIIMQASSRIVGTVILLYLTREAGFSPGALGLIFAAGGLTALIGAALAGRASRLAGLGPGMALALAGCGVGVLFIPLATGPTLFGFACLILNQIVTDPSWAFYTINEVSLRQAVAPNQIQGRVSASLRFLDFGAMLLGTLAAGILGQTLGLRAALWIAAAGMFAAAAAILASPILALRHLPTPEPLATSADGAAKR